MCGFAGFLTSDGMDAEAMSAALAPMIHCLAHRGPDQQGVWTSPDDGVGLGFRRLAIIDLTDEGHQPMKSTSGRFVLTFNGEIYNFGDLRAELRTRGHRFRGRSDTEVILAAFEEWGVKASFPRFNGMFALAVWDTERKVLVLARDRVGIKPLYVYHEPGFISFGSELKALQQGPLFDRALSPSALELYLRYLYVPAPQTIFRNANKLLPGCCVTILSVDQGVPPPEPYWSLADTYASGRQERIRSDGEAVERLEALLLDAVKLRMISDVPLGALLSGGVDSSTVVALMQELSERPVKTYTIGFDDAEFDESTDARSIAQHLGTDHVELRLTGQDALDVIPLLPAMFDEPHADPSQIPTYLVSKLARSEVTVALTGDGGDELFGGYNRYRYGAKTIERLSGMPRLPRHIIGAGVRAVSPERWARAYRTVAALIPGAKAVRLPGDKIRKLGDLLRADTQAEMYRSLMSAWQRPGEVVRGGDGVSDRAAQILARPGPAPLVERMMLADQTTYLPDDLLAKLDRASMAVSLEARVPILDHRIVELSWRLPQRAKIRSGVTKWALRQVLYRRVPRELIERPKTGFSVPIDRWLRGSLREWADELLSPESLKMCELLEPDPILREWEAVKSGSGSGLSVWTVLMFQAWRAEWA